MPDTHFSDNLLEKLKYFMEDNDPLRLSKSLRKVFFDYLKFQDGVVDKDFDNILTDVETVLNLLDAMTDEKNGRNKPA